MNPPFRADQVGSLLRPAWLSEARSKWRDGELDANALRELENRAILEAVTRQESIGLESVTDGEFRRDWWHLDFLSQLDGVTLVRNEGPKFRFAGQSEQPPIASVTGRIACTRPIMADHFAYLCDPKIRENCRANGDDPDRLPRTYAETINAALADRPPGMSVTIHTCRGNFQSAWVAEGGYEPVVEAMFSTDVDGWFMEFDSERAGGFEPLRALRALPEGRRVVDVARQVWG